MNPISEKIEKFLAESNFEVGDKIRRRLGHNFYGAAHVRTGTITHIAKDGTHHIDLANGEKITVDRHNMRGFEHGEGDWDRERKDTKSYTQNWPPKRIE